MKILLSLKHRRTEKNLQEKKQVRNRTALISLRECGFSMPCIRKALLDLNELSLDKIVDQTRASVVTVSRTIKGFRNNREAQELVSQHLGLGADELFPEYDKASDSVR